MSHSSTSARFTKVQGRRHRSKRHSRLLWVEALEDRRLLARTVGTLQHDADLSFEGFTLFGPELQEDTYLVDNAGRLVHKWDSDFHPANSVYLEPDGSIWRPGSLELNQTFPWNANGVGGLVQHISWEGEILHEFRLASTTGGPDSRILHHDIHVLPNGNVLMIAFDFMSEQTAIENGRDPDLVALQAANDKHLLPDSIIEVEFNDVTKRGTIVWEWHVEDHFVQDVAPNRLNYAADGVAAHPELIDINYVHPQVGAVADFTHANSVKYIPELDQIILSVRQYSEFWVIDHSTTWDPITGGESAAHSGGLGGRGGDLLYRWGNPTAYKAGSADDQQLFFQHDANWVPTDAGFDESANPGNFTAYSNGVARGEGPRFSRIVEFTPPLSVTRDPNTDEITSVEYTLSEDPYGTGDSSISAWGPVTPSRILAEFPEDATSPLLTGKHFSPIISGAQRLTNGNTLITEGVTGTIFEVTSDNDVVWEYLIPIKVNGPVDQGDEIPLVSFFPSVLNVHDNFAFKARRYATDYLDADLLADVDLQHRATIELNFGDTPGLYVPGPNTWRLNNRSDGSISDLITFSGPAVPTSWRPIGGDWNNDGLDTVGLYDALGDTFYLNNRTDGSITDLQVIHTSVFPDSFRPIAGDWNGDGIDTTGLYDPSSNTWYLNNSTTSWSNVILFTGPQHNSPSWQPIAGDWDGDGQDSVGLYVPSLNLWYLNNEIDGTIDELVTVRGPQHNAPNWRPIAGDWNTTGRDKIGLYDPRSNTWYLNNRIDGSVSDLIIVQGPQHRTPSWLPIAGNWDGSELLDGETEAGANGSDSILVDVGESEGYLAESLDEVADPFPRHNWLTSMDVNADFNVSPIDVLNIVNVLNRSAATGDMDGLPVEQTDEVSVFCDTNADGFCTPIDALLVVNFLNSEGGFPDESPFAPAFSFNHSLSSLARQPLSLSASLAAIESVRSDDGENANTGSRGDESFADSIDNYFAGDDGSEAGALTSTPSTRDSSTSESNVELESILQDLTLGDVSL